MHVSCGAAAGTVCAEWTASLLLTTPSYCSQLLGSIRDDTIASSKQLASISAPGSFSSFPRALSTSSTRFFPLRPSIAWKISLGVTLVVAQSMKGFHPALRRSIGRKSFDIAIVAASPYLSVHSPLGHAFSFQPFMMIFRTNSNIHLHL